MAISVWKYSHFALAVFSFIFLLTASVTGIILSLEPLFKRLNTPVSSHFARLTLAETVPVLRKKYPGITRLSVDQNKLILMEGTDETGNKLTAYVHPVNGKIIGQPIQSTFFQWVTSLHRSLFLHETGRALVGISAFLLFLIAISGIILVVKQQLGIKHFFLKITRNSFAQYYHVFLGRLALVPILMIAASGAYLSVIRFEIIKKKHQELKVDFKALKKQPEKAAEDFDYFKNTKLTDINSIEFPFSTDLEDYYIIHAKKGDFALNQITGEILAETKTTKTAWLEIFSLSIHTGRDSLIWAFLLTITSISILFLIYSGFAITLKRIRGKTKNKFKAKDCNIIILVGSEGGSTFKFAQAIYKQLTAQGEKVFVDRLNNYQSYPNAKHIMVFTATYGQGEAPSNARKFASLLKKYPQKQEISYAVLGFGSYTYADFCKFAVETEHLLAGESWAKPLIALHTVADKSLDDFNLWLRQWSQHARIHLNALKKGFFKKEKKLSEFTVQTVSETINETFTLDLLPKKNIRFHSGDLLAVYPANDHRERLYSIGKIDKTIRLCVKLYKNGLGSSFLHSLEKGSSLKAKIVSNKRFRFPAKAKQVIMIANGTGIAPFLGMIHANNPSVETYLYCGFRYQSSCRQYQAFISSCLQNRRLKQFHVSLSREQNKQYVFDLINREAYFFASVLNRNGKIMLCGSLAMQKDVFVSLEAACKQYNGKHLNFYQKRKQILTDCY